MKSNEGFEKAWKEWSSWETALKQNRDKCSSKNTFMSGFKAGQDSMTPNPNYNNKESV